MEGKKKKRVGPQKKVVHTDDGPKYGHKVFVGGIGNLTEEEIAAYFSKLGSVAGVSVGVKKGPDNNNVRAGYCFVTFQSKEVVQQVVEQQFVEIGQRRVEVTPYMPTAGTYWAKQNEKEEALLEIVESGTTSLKTLHIVEEGKEKVLSPGDSLTWYVVLKNRGSQTRVLYGADIVPKTRDLLVYDNTGRRDGNDGFKELGPSQSHSIKLVYKPQPPYRYGVLRWLLVIRGRNVNFSHPISLVIANKAELEMLQPDSEYQPKDLVIDNIERIIVPAFPPSRASKTHLHTSVETEWVEPLGRYDIPEDLQKEIDSKSQYSKFDPWLLKENYRKRLHTLLWIEEAQQKVNLRKYDLINTTLEPVKSYAINDTEYFPDNDDPIARLCIPGLAERRPSVLKGDIVYAWIPGTTDYEYEGFVHAVEQQHVLVMFCKDFHDRLTASSVFHIRFSFDRMLMRLMHRAIDVCDISLVWPECVNQRYSIRESLQQTTTKNAKETLGAQAEKRASLKISQWFDSLVSKNEEQAASVVHLLNKVQSPEDGSAPILMFGAFGTGKTRTLVEAIKQILTLLEEEKTKILVCAPSNSAADVFVERLAKFLSSEEMFRLNAFHRAGVPSTVQRYSNYDEENQVYNIPKLGQLFGYRVIVSTSHSAGSLFGVGVRKGHFSHIILDEAAQMMEAEALIPLSLADERCVIIMAGDDKQLGPHVQSPSCRVHGLGKSIMERIAALPVYKNQNNLCLGLTKNYRSHPVLLEFTSKAFYSGMLKANANHAVVSSLCDWHKLPNPKFPFVFFGVEGQDMREGDSPSFFNPYEAILVADLVEDLLNEKDIAPHDIGIITPYYKQTVKLRKVLRQRRMGGVMVGSVQEMQGKEKKAIFISTVRSSNHWQQHDRVYDLGFLNNERRLNTALTRAQALVVVVGDPYVLFNDRHWQELIRYCHKNKSYVGPEIGKEYFNSRKLKEQADAVRNAAPSEPPLIGTEGVDDNPAYDDDRNTEIDSEVEEKKDSPKTKKLEDVWALNKHKIVWGAPTKPTQPETRAMAQKETSLKVDVAPYYPKGSPSTSPALSRPDSKPAVSTAPPEASRKEPPQHETARQESLPTHPVTPALNSTQIRGGLQGAWQRPISISDPSSTVEKPPLPNAQTIFGDKPTEQRQPPPLHPLAPIPSQLPQPMGSMTTHQHTAKAQPSGGVSPPAIQPPLAGPALMPIPQPTSLNHSTPFPEVDSRLLMHYVMQMHAQLASLQQQLQLQQLQLQAVAQTSSPLPDMQPVESSPPLRQMYNPATQAQTENEQYMCVCSYHGVWDLIAVRTDLSCPSMTVSEEADRLLIQMPVFGLKWRYKVQGRLVYIALHARFDELKDTLFHVSVLHHLQNSHLSEKAKERSKTNAQLVIAVPLNFDETKVTLEERASVLTVTLFHLPVPITEQVEIPLPPSKDEAIGL